MSRAGSFAEKLQENVSLKFGLYLCLAFLVLQIALACAAPSFQGFRFYNFLLLSTVGLAAGCAGWACGIVLSPIGSQASGAQKVLAGFALFWTGAIAGHIPEISGALADWQKAQMNSALKIQAVFALGIFLLAACVTFNTRFDSRSIQSG